MLGTSVGQAGQWERSLLGVSGSCSWAAGQQDHSAQGQAVHEDAAASLGAVRLNARLNVRVRRSVISEQELLLSKQVR